MTSVAWFHAFSGIAGDMALGSCVAAGADVDEVRAILDRLPVDGWSLEFEDVLRGGIAATHAVVHVTESSVVRTAEHINGLIEEARLPERVRARSLATFHRLAEVEGHLHRRPPSQVHFHEVGGIDAIVDIVGTCAALETLGIDVVHAGPVATGVGMTRSAHGMIPVPAPAVVELLREAPVANVDVPYELTTPTGAALLSATVERWGPMPAMTVRSSGYGAGTRELDGRVNAVQLVTGTLAVEQSMVGEAQPLVELTVNVDDATGETLAHAVAALLDAGAADAWIVPVVMKKGRPGHLVCALVDAAAASEVAKVLTSETGSFGVRAQHVDRWPAARSFDSVAVDGHPIRIKVSPGRTKVEHDDAADVARRTGRPLREVVSLAEEAARRRLPSHPSDLGFDPDEPA
ncbi:nickel pincer cofactor biosynthesis protein LarC [Actinospongicola halichondriae]|uniref:nickel pincer cofactor biosynthesis protein LarC n=1 Tax=Actinospongicola halichondriae TaxID=3236844 RepID=UPI003D3DCD90